MLFYNENRKKTKTIIVEEPELNLFPTAQNSLVQYLVEKSTAFNNQILLTTHSPYILASVNNLIYGYKVGQTSKEDVDQILPQKYWLNPDEVSAYRLLSDGTSKDIIDKDLREIIVEELNARYT